VAIRHHSEANVTALSTNMAAYMTKKVIPTSDGCDQISSKNRFILPTGPYMLTSETIFSLKEAFLEKMMDTIVFYTSKNSYIWLDGKLISMAPGR